MRSFCKKMEDFKKTASKDVSNLLDSPLLLDTLSADLQLQFEFFIKSDVYD